MIDMLLKMTALRFMGLSLLFALAASGRQEEDPAAAKPKRAPRFLTLATAEDAGSGILAWTDDELITLVTDRGERAFRWEDLQPYSAWRARSILAERDAAKHLQLAEFCREKKLHRQARWEYAAARALDPKAEIPDLEELRKLDAEAFMPHALALAPAAIAKQLEKESADALAARAAAVKKRMEELKKDKGVTDIRTLVARGDGSRRLDIVFACDGFAEADQPKYHALADQLVKAVLKVEPMANYPSYINFHRVSIVEATSGLRGGRTRLGCKVEQGILTCDRDKAWEVASLAPDADLIFVIANVKDVRATGGHGILTLDASGDINDTSIHELGHAFADLDDEYVDETVQDRHPAWDPSEENQHVNTTQVSEPGKVKWHYWNNPPVKGFQVGCYEGAYYREKGFYRPSPDCRMRDSSTPMCPICFEAMEKSLYSLVSPIDSALPLLQSTRGFQDDEFSFTASAVLTEGKAAALGSLSAAWYVDGVRDTSRVSSKDKTTGLKARGLNLKPGKHEVALRVDFQNKRVRRDDGLLSGHRVWQVEVLPFNRPKIALTGDLAKGPVAVKLEGTAAQSGVKAVFLGGPPGAEIDAADALTCPSDPALAGARVIRFGYLGKEGVLGSEDRTFPLAHADGRNLKPFLRLAPEIDAVEGKPLYSRVDAWDPDGDLLAFSATGLPEGASLDPQTGEIYWDVGYTQGGRYEGIKITATDGFQQATATTCLVVREQPIDSQRFNRRREGGSVGPELLRGFDIILALRSHERPVKEGAITELARYGTTFRVLEYARLLRDRDPEFVTAALAGLEGMLDSSDAARLRSMIIADVEAHVWHFTDSPKVLEFLNGRLTAPEGLDAAAKQKAEALRKMIKAVAAYNKSRGI
ncbi:MAG TPA: M64 family metallopeptidase [Planctomycetota bacterium]|nr:M64 family metallopeptidase [Planctomycetota bacterium]